MQSAGDTGSYIRITLQKRNTKVRACCIAFNAQLPILAPQVLAHISLMRPGAAPSASSDASRPQAPPVILVPGPRVAASEPSRVISEPDVMSLGRSNLSDDSSGSSSSFVRSRHAEEAAARARSLSNESQLNLRSSPWQDAGSEHSGSTATAGARRPSANVMGDVSSSRALQHAPAASASDSLAVFEKPLLAALSGDEISGMHAAEVIRTVCFLRSSTRV